MLLMSARAAGAPHSLTSNEQSRRDSVCWLKGLTANAGSKTPQRRCQTA